jgi:sigma-B regulation protein RsbQ
VLNDAMLYLGIALSLALVLTGCAGRGGGDTARSADGVPIHYRAAGTGDVVLVFLHGWMGDTTWWEPQLTYFASRYRVVAIDLAGHGKSGHGRTTWTIPAFAADVKAAADRLDLKRMVLVGHSMSGPVSVEAARILGDRVVALVPVDTLHDVQRRMSADEKARVLGDLRRDFHGSVRNYLRGVAFAPTSPPHVVKRVLAQIDQVPPDLGLAILEAALDYDVRPAIRQVRVPIRAINADLQPTAVATNRAYVRDFDVILIPGVGHWPMLEAPERFNAALDRVLQKLGLGRQPATAARR